MKIYGHKTANDEEGRTFTICGFVTAPTFEAACGAFGTTPDDVNGFNVVTELTLDQFLTQYRSLDSLNEKRQQLDVEAAEVQRLIFNIENVFDTVCDMDFVE